MKILLAPLLVLISLVCSSQNFHELPKTAQIAYAVDYQDQLPASDILFTQLRAIGLRQLAGNGEISKNRTVYIGKKPVQYGVAIYYDAEHLYVRFYSDSTFRNQEKVITAIHRDFNDNVKM